MGSARPEFILGRLVFPSDATLVFPRKLGAGSILMVRPGRHEPALALCRKGARPLISHGHRRFGNLGIASIKAPLERQEEAT